MKRFAFLLAILSANHAQADMDACYRATCRVHANGHAGTGCVYAKDAENYYVLTNAHVVDGADEVLVTLTDKREFKARIVGADKRTDVAVVKIQATDLPAVKVDTNGVFVQRNGSRAYELSVGNTYNYEANDLTAIVPEIGTGGFRRIAVQRQPDTRIHFVRADGKVAILIYDRVEKVTCWILYETDGLVEDAVVLPGTTEDNVYYTVARTINGSTKRYREKWALESEAIGAARTILTDSTYVWTGASSATITGLSHLEGETVTVWANSKDLGTYTVAMTAVQVVALMEDRACVEIEVTAVLP